MPQFVSRPPQIEFSEIVDIVREAAGALGYFEADHADILAARMRRLWCPTPWTFAFAGETVVPDPQRPHFTISREMWDATTEKGRNDISYACKATCLRIIFNVRRAVAMQQEQKYLSRIDCNTAEFQGMSEYTCPQARRLQGRTVPLADRWALPLPDCAADWCACRWDLIPDYD